MTLSCGAGNCRAPASRMRGACVPRPRECGELRSESGRHLGSERHDVRGAERRACRAGDRRSKPGVSSGLAVLRRARRGATRVPVWRPAVQAGGVIRAGGVPTCAARSAGACRAGDRRSKPGVSSGLAALRRARRGATRVPGWRPAVQAGGVVWAGGVATCAARSDARAGLETGGPSRGCRLGSRRCDVRGAERRACRAGDRRSRPGVSSGLAALRRARRGATRVPGWRPAVQAGGAATGSRPGRVRGTRRGWPASPRSRGSVRR